jgi:hypothetical protein
MIPTELRVLAFNHDVDAVNKYLCEHYSGQDKVQMLLELERIGCTIRLHQDSDHELGNDDGAVERCAR